MSKKRNTRNRSSRTQSKISKIFSSFHHETDAKELFLSKLSSKEIKANFSKVAKHVYFRDAVDLSLSGIDTIYRPKTPDTNLEKSLSWCISLVLFHKDKIQFALDLESELQHCILTKNYDSALSILDKVDKKCGISLRTITLRRSLGEFSQGTLTNSDGIELLESQRKNSLLSIVVHYSTSFFSDQATLISDMHVLRTEIEKSPLDKELKDLFLYKFFSYCEDEKSFTNVFNYEKHTSIIDIFFLLITYFSDQFMNKNLSEIEQDNRKSHIMSLNNSFDYSVVQRLANCSGIKTEWKTEEAVYKTVDLYSSGHYQAVVDLIYEKELFAYDFCFAELSAKAWIRSEKKAEEQLEWCYANAIINVITKNKDFKLALPELFYFSYKFRTVSWFTQLLCFLRREYFSLSDSQARDRNDNLIILFSKSNTPRVSKIFPTHIQRSYMESLNRAYPNSATNILFNAFNDKNAELISNLKDIESARSKKYIARILTSEGEFPDACSLLYELKESSDSLMAIESTKLLIQNLIEMGEIDEALQHFVKIILENNNLLNSFDVPFIFASIEDKIKNNQNINLPIAFSFYSRFIDSKFDSHLKYSFETFLANNGISTPLALFEQEAKYGQIELHYFFEKICTPQVMSLFTNFSSMREIEECRLDICTYLSDKKLKDEHLLNEIISINKLHLTKRAVKKVENSRIYIDSSVFFGRNSEQFKVLFNRYKELYAENEYDNSEDETTLKALLTSIKSSDLEDETEQPLTVLLTSIRPVVKLNKKNATFFSLAKLVKHEFTYGEQGLNNYLSTRIRHGMFPRTFRSSIVQESLYVSVSDKVDDFCNSWQSKYPKLMPEGNDGLEQLWKLLSSFSKEYEKIISLVNDVWLRIYSLEDFDSTQVDTQNRALFNYNTSSLDTFNLQQELPLSPSYEDFINVAMQWLWDKTESNLTVVQGKIANEAQRQAMSLLATLREDILDSNFSEYLKQEICNSIDRAKQSLRANIDVICSWFTHVDIDDEDEEFDIDIAVDIVRRSLLPNISLENNVQCYFTERNLFHIVDVFYILLENAVSKSNVPKESLSIQIFINKSAEGLLHICVKNNLRIEKSISEMDEDLDFYREAYGNEEQIKDKLQQEGGSGFFKVWKIIQKDLEIDHEIQFGIDEDENFSVELTLNKSSRLRLA